MSRGPKTKRPNIWWGREQMLIFSLPKLSLNFLILTADVTNHAYSILFIYLFIYSWLIEPLYRRRQASRQRSQIRINNNNQVYIRSIQMISSFVFLHSIQFKSCSSSKQSRTTCIASGVRLTHKMVPYKTSVRLWAHLYMCIQLITFYRFYRTCKGQKRKCKKGKTTGLFDVIKSLIKTQMPLLTLLVWSVNTVIQLNGQS